MSLHSVIKWLVPIVGGIVLAYAGAVAAAGAEESVRVLAAASLTSALTEVARDWKLTGHPDPLLDFSSSGTLAKQIEAGAPADLFASADARWMDYLDSHGAIEHASRVNLLTTDLVLIAPAASPVKIELRPDFPIASAFTGQLCTGEPGSVPVGIYAQQALERLGWWDALKGRIVGTDDVRSALAFVERGECALGIVYATDARISQKVRIVASFPADSHDPIVYPVALVRGASPAATELLRYLASAQADRVFRQYGFEVLPH